MLATTCAFAGGSMFSGNSVGEQLVGGGVRAAGAGGTGIALADSMSFHSGNPALIALATRTMFRMSGHVAWWGTSADGRNDTDAETVWQDVGVYLPLSSVWKIGLVAEPTRYADLATFGQRTAVFNDTNAVHYEQRDVWQNGTVDLRIENAWRIGDRAALGIGAVYTIMRNANRHTIDLDQHVSSSYYLDASYRQVETYRGWTADIGAFARITSKLSAGVVYRPRGSGEWTYEFQKSQSDSVNKSERTGGSPGNVKAGISYAFSPRLIGLADAHLGQWEQGDLGALADAKASEPPVNPLFLAAGIERTPERSPVRPGFNNWGIRGGVYYRQHYWPEQSGAAVEEFALTFGLSAPFIGSTAYLHWAGEVGQRGFDEDKLGARETFFRTSIQIEIAEQWFQKQKPRLPQ